MQVKDLLAQLEEYEPETELIVAYWDKETIEGYGSGYGGKPDLKLTDEQWSDVVFKYENGEWYWQGSAAEDFADIANEVVSSS